MSTSDELRRDFDASFALAAQAAEPREAMLAVRIAGAPCMIPLADVANWRLVYVVSLVWLIVAVDVSRRLTETPRFEHVLEAHQVGRTHVDRRRFAIILLREEMSKCRRVETEQVRTQYRMGENCSAQCRRWPIGHDLIPYRPRKGQTGFVLGGGEAD